MLVEVCSDSMLVGMTGVLIGMVCRLVMMSWMLTGIVGRLTVVIKLLNSFVALKGEIRTTKFSIKRLKSCLQYRVIPTYLAHRLKRSKVKFSLTIEKAFINDELQHAFRRLEKLCRDYKNAPSFLAVDLNSGPLFK